MTDDFYCDEVFSGKRMTDDFYCDEVFSGKTPVEKVFETERVLAYHHTRPFWPVHIVVVPKQHVDSLLTVEDDLLVELMNVAKEVAGTVLAEHGAVRVLTNLGEYQDSKHLHFHVLSGESPGTPASRRRVEKS